MTESTIPQHAGTAEPTSIGEMLPEIATGRSPSRAKRWALQTAVVIAGVAALAAVELTVVSTFAAGIPVTGDEPGYLVAAQAFLHHGTPLVIPVYKVDLAHHLLSAFPPGTKWTTPGVTEGFGGPHGVVSPFEPGVAWILAPFWAIAGQRGAFVGFFLVEAVLLVLTHRILSARCRLSAAAQVVLAVAFVAPAALVAMAQIYPDLMSGCILAVGIACTAFAERHPDRRGAVIGGMLAAAALPWLQTKNVVLGGVLALALAATLALRRHRRAAAVVVLTFGVSCAALAAYNLYWFGHLLGFPEAALHLDHQGQVDTIALLFDRDHGLVVQLPTVLLGVAGVWLGRRTAPAAVATAAITAGAVILMNGAYTGNPFGGFSPAGRFQWTAMPVLVAAGAFTLAHVQQRWRWRALARPGLVLLGVLIVAAWCWQGAGLAVTRHPWFDLYAPLAVRPPIPASVVAAQYPGWWYSADRFLPEIVLGERRLGQPATGIPACVVGAVGLCFLPLLLPVAGRRLLAAGAHRRRRATGGDLGP